MMHVSYGRSGQMEIIHLKNKPFVYHEHNHVSVYTIGFVLQGEILLACGNRQSLYKPNSYFIIAPYQVHALTLPQKYELVTICIDKKLVAARQPGQLFSRLSKLLLKFPVNIHYSLLEQALKVLCQCEVPQFSNNEITSSALAVCCCPENNNRLEFAADAVSYSVYHYIKLFKKKVGVTPHKFQIQNRVRKAQRMIEQGQCLTRIGLELGFYDQSHFIKYFKKMVGLTPSEYSMAFRQLP